MVKALGKKPAKNELVNPSEVETVGGSGRHFIDFIVKINGMNLDDLGISGLVRVMQVKQSIIGVSEIYVEFTNVNNRLDNFYLFKEGNEVEIYLGWQGIDIEYFGKFIMDLPKYTYSAFNSQTISFRGYNKLRLLGRGGMKRRSFEQKKDSEIAQEIAKEYGLQTDIKDTKVTYAQIVQANLIDHDFLQQRAELYGYSVYIDKDTLHFHPPEFEDTGKQIVINLRDPKAVPVVNFDLKTMTYLQAMKVKKEQLNWENLDHYREEDQDEDDPLLSATKGQETGVQKASAIVPIQAIHYLVGSGHIQTIDELKRQTEKFSLSSRWLVQATGTVIGLEFAQAGKVLRIKTNLKYSGPYLILDCVHELNMSRRGVPIYTTDFTLIRTFNKTDAEPVNLKGNKSSSEDITNSLPTSGSATVV